MDKDGEDLSEQHGPERNASLPNQNRLSIFSESQTAWELGYLKLRKQQKPAKGCLILEHLLVDHPGQLVATNAALLTP